MSGTDDTLDLQLRSSVFRAEREKNWRRLEELLNRTDRRGVSRLNAAEILELQSLYRLALSSLSVARSTSLDKGVTEYLEALSSRAYMVVYGKRRRFWASMLDFLFHIFPGAVRALRWHLLLATIIFAMGAAIGFSLTVSGDDWYFALMPEGLMQGRSPHTPVEQLRDGLFDKTEFSDRLSAFATVLFTHNSRIGWMAFALGFMFGIPTALLVAYNGVILGTFVALYFNKGLGVEVLGWLSIHGTTEILAILLCGAAGFAIGGAAIFPGRKSRIRSLMDIGRQSGVVAVGCLLMFLVAGLLEGIGRQVIVDTDTRFLIGAGALSAWALYFGLSARHRPAVSSDGAA